MTDYDLIVIGAGAVGENVADRATQGGLSVVIIEQDLVGGSCSYWACVPSKVLLRSGAALTAARRVPGARESLSNGVDTAAVFKRRNWFTGDWNDDGQADWLKSAGIDLLRGQARITGEREVTVDTGDGSQVLTARHAVAVCTGSASLLPDVPGLADARPWTSSDATSVQEAPESLAIIGGGVVAAELATAFASFGTKVSVISRGGLLARMEPFAGDAVATALRDAGADVHLNTTPTRVSRNGGGVTVHWDGGEVTAKELLVATGRVPRTGGLGLESVGLTDGDWLSCDDTLRVQGVDWLYAAGDVTHRALLTHQGKYQARVAGDAIAARATGRSLDVAPWGAHAATADHEAVPQVTFTEPEVASVGLTEAAARKAGYTVRVVDYDIGKVQGAMLLAKDYAGQARLVVDTDRQVLLGATFVGQDVGELLHAATIAVVGEVPIERLWHAVPAYPTVSEIWLRLLETWRDEG
ncbi:NAD(P)/FAD-dependent oxidoreductase [Diaminobutyricimonas sp. LJ205]|uniref:dihydrolipoyl dehydrogenase family protein n=1 Tax=Diaminobutyricimonas sp. LJ205 TaxID=2683590 RepID=UPI0012F4E8E8|nr:NAD(P)/FAD-dependent oxidoreductase [Diaminobutyricimonas sp. LJ205]